MHIEKKWMCFKWESELMSQVEALFLQSRDDISFSTAWDCIPQLFIYVFATVSPLLINIKHEAN